MYRETRESPKRENPMDLHSPAAPEVAAGANARPVVSRTSRWARHTYTRARTHTRINA